RDHKSAAAVSSPPATRPPSRFALRRHRLGSAFEGSRVTGLGIRGSGIHDQCLGTRGIRSPPMPVGTALHERTLALCESLNYREWSGYYAVSAYEGHHEHEYNAI